MTNLVRTIAVDIPAPSDWAQRVKGLTARLAYFQYPEDEAQNGWYLDFTLDALPRYFGPFKTAADGRSHAVGLGMNVVKAR